MIQQSLLQIRDLAISFTVEAGKVGVVRDLDLDVLPGEIVALVGESGCGKSITARSILGLLPLNATVDHGSVLVSGQDVLKLPATALRHLRGREVTMVFQEPAASLNPVFTVGYQLTNAIRLHEKLSQREALGRAKTLLDRVGLPDPEARLRDYPHQLSGGMQQRVMIALALAPRPKLLIADEPTTALDMTIQAQILVLLSNLQREFGMSILLITHNFGVVNELADRVAVMHAGTIVECGTRSEVLGRPAHPYTQALLKAVPVTDERATLSHGAPGDILARDSHPIGCRFAPYCQKAMPVCHAVTPAAVSVSPSHVARCHALT